MRAAVAHYSVHTPLGRGRRLLLQLEVAAMRHLLANLAELRLLRRQLLVSAPLLLASRLVVVDDGVRARRSSEARAERRV